jgi:hypothetical protein
VIENVLSQWASETIRVFPVLVFLAIAALDLRRSLKSCMEHNQEVLNRLLDVVVDKRE